MLDLETFEKDLIEKKGEYFKLKDYTEYFGYYNNIQDKDDKIQCILGILYYSGIGTEENLEKSLHWYTLSAKQNNGCAQNNLGVYYEEIEEDYEKAQHLYILSANQGNSNAQYNLALYYEEIEKDYEKALHWFTKANNTEKINEMKEKIRQNVKLTKDININSECECSICKESFLNQSKSVLTIQCGHSFHLNCIEQWQRKCPLCFIDVQ